MDMKEVIELSIHDEVPLASLQPALGPKPKLKPKTTLEGTPRKGKRMDNILRAILKFTKTEESFQTKVAPPSPKRDSALGVENVEIELAQKLDDALKGDPASDKIVASKVYTIPDKSKDK